MKKFEDENVETVEDNVDAKKPTSFLQGELLKEAVRKCNLK